MKTIIPFTTDFRQLDEMLNRAFSHENEFVTLPIDATDLGESITIRASVPGVDPENISITVEKGILSIKGEVPVVEIPEGAKVLRRETTTGKFSRSLRLSENLNTDAVEAKFKHGVVTITIPKQEPAPIHRIQVVTEN